VALDDNEDDEAGSSFIKSLGKLAKIKADGPNERAKRQLEAAGERTGSGQQIESVNEVMEGLTTDKTRR